MFVNIFCLWQTYNFNDSETHIFEAKAHNPRTNDNAVEQLEKRENETQAKVDELQKKVSERREQLDTLKHELYDKFGRGAINLDE